jgi:hypothetical protein
MVEIVPAIQKESSPIAHDALDGRGCIKLSPKSVDNQLKISWEVVEHGFVDLPRMGAIKDLHRRRDLGVHLCGNAPNGDVDEIQGRKAHVQGDVGIERGSHSGKRTERGRSR